MSKQHTQRAESLVEAASLSAIDLFRGLPASCLEMLKEKSEVRDFRKGHVFFRPGECGQVLFLLEKGHVQTFRTTAKRKLIIAELPDGGVMLTTADTITGERFSITLTRPTAQLAANILQFVSRDLR